MTSSRWTRQSALMSRNGGLVIYGFGLILVSVAGGLFQTGGVVGILGAVSVLIGLVVMIVTFRNRDTPLLIRTLKMDYDSAEFALRMIFKNERILFQRQAGEELDTHKFEFPNHNLSLSICPYDLINGVALGRDAVSKKVIVDSAGVLVTLQDVTSANQAFVDKLTTAIDKMAEQQQIK